MPYLDLQIDISADEMLQYYRGQARVVHALADNGQSVNFPASALQRYVTAEGVHGRFRLVFDQQHKLLSLEPATAGDGLDRRA